MARLGDGEHFFRARIQRIFTEKTNVVDIGGGLRIDPRRGNQFDPARAAWIRPLIRGTRYQILDQSLTYRPHIVGDVQSLPFSDGEIDAIVCMSVLESVADPFQAMKDLRRALKPGGFLFLYLAFLYPHVPVEGYYRDYWRFSLDAVRLLAAPFTTAEFFATPGRVTAMSLVSPFARFGIARRAAAQLDSMLYRSSSQVVGHYAFLVK